MKEEGVIYFPGQTRNNNKGKENNHEGAKKPPSSQERPVRSSFFADKKPTELNENYFSEWTGNDSTPHPITQSKSPQFAKDIIFSGMFHSSDQKSKEYLKPTLSSGQKVKIRDEQPKLRNSATNNNFKNHHQTRSSYENKPRDSSLNRSSSSKPSEFKSKNKDFKHVESKIKDEINYHKELSKQYRKMKQSMGQLESEEPEFIDNPTLSTHENFDKFAREENKKAVCPNPFEESSKRFMSYSRSQLMDSNNSAQRSSLNMQLYGEKTPSQTAMNNLKKTENTWRNGNMNKYNNTEETRGGMLDIANNFLNSPLMQHLSNIDIKNLDTSMKDSIFNTNIKPSKNSDSSIFATGADNGVDELDQNFRLQQSYGGLQQSQNSKWRNKELQKEGTEIVDNYILKDSTNKRFKDNMTKELGESRKFLSLYF